MMDDDGGRMESIRKVSRGGNQVALVLQGGGALGAYQAGVYQALHESGLTPDWVVGTSIGATNAALIAGNQPELRLSRLEEFWYGAARDDLIDMVHVPDMLRRFNIRLATLYAMVGGVHGMFAPRPFNPFAMGLKVPPEQASFYDTRCLAQTLARLVDFDYLMGPASMRLTVSAVQVTCGRLVHFDTTKQQVGVDHIMASGALPPGFPPVRVDGKLYWDGGMYSNTPLSIVLDEEPQRDTLCFMVDLWSGNGEEPETLDEVLTREKDVMYTSRSKRHIEDYLRLNTLRHAARSLLNQIPPDQRTESELEQIKALGAATTMHIVSLPYTGRDWNMPLKDVNFSRGSIGWRWKRGYDDALRVIHQACWLVPVPDNSGVVVHEITPS
jgi:NTE family protein